MVGDPVNGFVGFFGEHSIAVLVEFLRTVIFPLPVKFIEQRNDVCAFRIGSVLNLIQEPNHQFVQRLVRIVNGPLPLPYRAVALSPFTLHNLHSYTLVNEEW